jgi:hypothetical protein
MEGMEGMEGNGGKGSGAGHLEGGQPEGPGR